MSAPPTQWAGSSPGWGEVLSIDQARVGVAPGEALDVQNDQRPGWRCSHRRPAWCWGGRAASSSRQEQSGSTKVHSMPIRLHGDGEQVRVPP